MCHAPKTHHYVYIKNFHGSQKIFKISGPPPPHTHTRTHSTCPPTQRKQQQESKQFCKSMQTKETKTATPKFYCSHLQLFIVLFNHHHNQNMRHDVSLSGSSPNTQECTLQTLYQLLGSLLLAHHQLIQSEDPDSHGIWSVCPQL